MATVLVVEDDPKSADAICAILAEEGLRVTTVQDGAAAFLQAKDQDFDAIVLDRMLPGGIDGVGVLDMLRKAGIRTPVLILSALSALEERVRGLRAGGDDYLAKPFEPLELAARVMALIRRRVAETSSISLEQGRVRIDLIAREAWVDGQKIELQARELQLLAYLVRHHDRPVSRAMIFEDVWGYRYDQRTNVIDVHVTRLRRKIERGDLPPLIETVRGTGYVFRSA
ncbi:response regulator transcription factor [Sphingomonas sp. 10B4]|uniref:response regulator transcription factor n=1 Tax=Sphingomonas sp. 10B4 TaxID=3048575 RepID=UPI002AB499ED|nr:response regulator transcription factor [Sphingomonas sp. 10B4]MDY7523334.1 response regulator transcription factor [Sphingomonas sp. 10B4]MEB0284033.1 response regulator transcription factor [Sphingomonas sp. 10B4]